MGYGKGNANDRDNKKTDAGLSFPGLTRESSEDRPCFNPTSWMHAGRGHDGRRGDFDVPDGP